MKEESIDNQKFIEWTKEIFSAEHCPGPRHLVVFSVETAQMLIDRGVPHEWITVIRPLPRKRKSKNGNKQ